MKLRHESRAPALLGALALLLLTAGADTPRGPGRTPPTPPRLEAEIQADREAACAAADVRGDTYRPFFCEPRCDCVPPGVLADLESCVATGDTYAATGESAQPVAGSCRSIDQCVNGPAGRMCEHPWSTGCSTSADCENGLCFAEFGGPDGCVSFCSDGCPSEPGAAYCTRSYNLGCSTDTDCDSGDECILTAAGFPGQPLLGYWCKTHCAEDAECEVETTSVSVTLFSVSMASDPQPASCTVSHPSASGATVISNNDAQACLALIEAATGPCR